MAPDPSPNMTEQSDEATGFFSLPRELRDRIYDMVREDRCKKSNDVHFDFRAAIPEKRLVSRQFKSEYDERSAVNTFVNVFDMFDMFDRYTFKDVPRLAHNAFYLEHDWDSASDDEDEMPMLLPDGARVELSLEARLKSLEELASHFPKVKNVHIQLSHWSTHDLKDVVNALIACRVLTSFTIRSHEFSDEGVDFAIWSREHGILIDNTDEEKAKQLMEAALEIQKRRLEEEWQKWTHSSDFAGYWTT